jgi:hypothetical protein
MSRTGPRPHTWLVQGEIPHQQHIAWQRAKAQANFRGEVWLLSFEDFQRLWQEHWQQRGRGSDGYCLTRDDPDGAWALGNVDCIPRVEHLKRQKLYKTER